MLPELDASLAEIATRILRGRGADIRVSTPVRSVEPGHVHLAEETLEAETVVLVAGIVPNEAVGRIPVAHDERGRIEVDATLRSRSHPEVWAVGDCAYDPGTGRAAVPGARTALDPRGQATREKPGGGSRRPRPATLPVRLARDDGGAGPDLRRREGLRDAVDRFPAWWLRRTYYLLQMPRWDRRLRIVLDWTVALFFRPDITKIDLSRSRR